MNRSENPHNAYAWPLGNRLIVNMEGNQEKVLISIFQKYSSVSPSSLSRLLEACEIKQFKKGNILSTKDKTDSFEYFLIDVIACRYLFDKEGEIVVSGFYLPAEVITPNFARTVNARSIYNLEVLSDGYLARIPVKVMDSLRYSYKDIRIFGAKVVERELTKIISAEISYRVLTAKERLLSFRKEYPGLENLISHSFIASYLGITPVSFSRLRNELTRR